MKNILENKFLSIKDDDFVVAAKSAPTFCSIPPVSLLPELIFELG